MKGVKIHTEKMQICLSQISKDTIFQDHLQQNSMLEGFVFILGEGCIP